MDGGELATKSAVQSAAAFPAELDYLRDEIIKNAHRFKEGSGEDFVTTMDALVERAAERWLELTFPEEPAEERRKKVYNKKTEIYILVLKNYDVMLPDITGEIAKNVVLGLQGNFTYIHEKFDALKPVLGLLKSGEIKLIPENIKGSINTILNNAILDGDPQVTLDVLKSLHNAGVDLSGALQSALKKPTAHNFELFKYMVDELKLDVFKSLQKGELPIAQQLDPQKAPLSTEKSHELLAYVRSKLSIGQQNEMGLLGIVFFFGDEGLFKELLPNKSIDINPRMNRTNLFRGLTMGPREFTRLELIYAYLEGERLYKEVEMLPEQMITQVFQSVLQYGKDDKESIEILQKVANKLKVFPNYVKQAEDALSMVMSVDQIEQYVLPIYNSAILSSREFFRNNNAVAILSGHDYRRPFGSLINLLFLVEPSLLTEMGVLPQHREAKLVYILETALKLPGLNYNMYAKDEHRDIIEVLMAWDKGKVEQLAMHLFKQIPEYDTNTPEENVKKIEEYIKNLRILDPNNTALDKLKGAMANIAQNPKLLQEQQIEKPRGLLARAWDALKQVLQLIPFFPHSSISAKGIGAQSGMKSIDLRDYLTQEKLTGLVEKLQVEEQKRLEQEEAVSKVDPPVIGSHTASVRSELKQQGHGKS